MVARGGASNASATPGDRDNNEAPEGRRNQYDGSGAPPGLHLFESCPGVALRSTPGYHPTPLRGYKTHAFGGSFHDPGTGERGTSSFVVIDKSFGIVSSADARAVSHFSSRH